MHGPEAARIMREELNYRGVILGMQMARYIILLHIRCVVLSRVDRSNLRCNHRYNWQCAARGYRRLRVQWGQPSGHQTALQGEAHGRAEPLRTHGYGSGTNR